MCVNTITLILLQNSVCVPCDELVSWPGLFPTFWDRLQTPNTLNRTKRILKMDRCLTVVKFYDRLASGCITFGNRYPYDEEFLLV